MLPLSDPYAQLNLVSALFIYASAAVPLYLSTKLSGSLRNLTLVFAAFVLVHGVYHTVSLLGFVFLGEGFFEPLSVVLLIAFGLSYLRLVRGQEFVSSRVSR